jgi:hypothetical protein
MHAVSCCNRSAAAAAAAENLIWRVLELHRVPFHSRRRVAATDGERARFELQCDAHVLPLTRPAVNNYADFQDCSSPISTVKSAYLERGCHQPAQ